MYNSTDINHGNVRSILKGYGIMIMEDLYTLHLYNDEVIGIGDIHNFDKPMILHREEMPYMIEKDSKLIDKLYFYFFLGAMTRFEYYNQENGLEAKIEGMEGFQRINDDVLLNLMVECDIDNSKKHNNRSIYFKIPFRKNYLHLDLKSEYINVDSRIHHISGLYDAYKKRYWKSFSRHTGRCLLPVEIMTFDMIRSKRYIEDGEEILEDRLWSTGLDELGKYGLGRTIKNNPWDNPWGFKVKESCIQDFVKYDNNEDVEVSNELLKRAEDALLNINDRIMKIGLSNHINSFKRGDIDDLKLLAIVQDVEELL